MVETKKINWSFALGIPLLIFISSYLITLTSKFKLNESLLSNAVLIDLVFIAPLAYFLVIRKTAISNLTVIRVFIVGLLVAGLLLNSKSTILFDFITTWLAPIIEFLALVIIGRKFYLAIKKARAVNEIKPDFLTHCRNVMFNLLGNEKTGNIISSEIAVLFYAFNFGKNKTIDYKKTFTSYKESGITLVLGTFLFLFIAETIGMHLILSLGNLTLAWVLTGLSFYTCLQLFAHIRAIKARPITIHHTYLGIHNGLAGDAIVQFNNIQKIECSKRNIHDSSAVKIGLLNGLENHNFVIHLKQPIEVTKIFGIKKNAQIILFFADKPDTFLSSLKSAILESNCES